MDSPAVMEGPTNSGWVGINIYKNTVRECRARYTGETISGLPAKLANETMVKKVYIYLYMC